jgi:hypothetical protein
MRRNVAGLMPAQLQGKTEVTLTANALFAEFTKGKVDTTKDHESETKVKERWADVEEPIKAAGVKPVVEEVPMKLIVNDPRMKLSEEERKIVSEVENLAEGEAYMFYGETHKSIQTLAYHASRKMASVNKKKGKKEGQKGYWGTVRMCEDREKCTMGLDIEKFERTFKFECRNCHLCVP